MPSQAVLDEKAGEIEEIKDILQGYKSIGICSLQKVRASQLQGMKKNFKNKVYVRVLKNSLMKLALESMEKQEEIRAYLNKQRDLFTLASFQNILRTIVQSELSMSDTAKEQIL